MIDKMRYSEWSRTVEGWRAAEEWIGRYRGSVTVIGVARYPGQLLTFLTPLYAAYGVPTFSLSFGYDDEKLNLDKPMTRRLRVVARRPHQHHNLEVNSPYYDVSEARGCSKCWS